MLDKLFIGIEIGGTKLQAVLGDADGNIIKTFEDAADAAGGASAILSQLETMVGRFLNESNHKVVGMGIGFGGPVDATQGVVIKSNHVAGWESVSLANWAAKNFQLPCAVGNDTDVAALAEARVGGGQQDACVFYTNIGSGIGGGLVVDGRLYARPSGALEFGHTRVYSHLDQRWGILEDFCSGWALDRRAREAAERDRRSQLWNLAGNVLADMDASVLFDAWELRDEAATQVVECFLDCYSIALSNLIALLNPDLVIIGGGVAQRGKSLLTEIRTRTSKLIYEPFANSYRIELTTLQKNAVPVGALLTAAEHHSLPH